MNRTNRDEPRQALSETVARCRAAGDALELADALRELAEFERRAGERERARAHYDEVVALRRAARLEAPLAHALLHLGDVHRDLRDPQRSQECYAEGLRIYESLADIPPLDLANAFRRMAVLKHETGEPAESLRLWERAHELYVRVGYEPAVKESAARIARLQSLIPNP
jgi:tetratricopeptide (TPR) repeat protein